MEWVEIGKRIRKQRESLGYTRESFAERLDVTPKFCSDIELGLKGMSIPTLCKISVLLKLPTDYILFGVSSGENSSAVSLMLQRCTEREKYYAESMVKLLLSAMDTEQQETNL